MAQASALMSSKFWSRFSRRATSSSWTTSASHEGRAVRAAIRAAQAKLFFLPASAGRALKAVVPSWFCFARRERNELRHNYGAYARRGEISSATAGDLQQAGAPA
jgi:hypothetical protein